MKRFTSIPELVDSLLDRLEARPDSARLMTYVGEFSSVTQQDEFAAELSMLENAGGVAVKRGRIDGVEMIQHVRLGDADVLYRYRQRTPSAVQADAHIRTLRLRPDLAPAVVAVLDDVEAAWSRNVSWSGLLPGHIDELVEALALTEALASDKGEERALSSIDYRTFSRRAVGNSKSLERQARLVVHLLRRLHPELGIDEGLDDADVLACLGVERLPQPLLVGGPISLDGVPAPRMPFLGLPPEQVHRLAVAKIDYILTVENYASFVRHCREVNGQADGLIVYSGGFPARAVLRSIIAVAKSADAPIFHWGDLDPGGLRIFVHLEDALRSVGISLRPHLMDSELLNRLGRMGETSTSTLRHGSAIGSAIGALWDEMAGSTGRRTLEQEELDPARPV